MIDNNIISSLGAGSGIDTKNLVDQLTAIEKAPRQGQIDSRREKLEAQISDFGLLRSALATLQDSADLLGDDSFGAMTASFTDSDVLTPTELGDDAPPGDYTFEVLAIARAQSLSTGALFTDPADAVGKGTLTFDFGDWDATTDNFTVNGERPSQIITIDDSNNSLTGLRDAINAADIDVQASVIQDGTGYRLLLKAPSGENNQLRITAAEAGGSPTNVDANDLSRFAFGAGAANQQMNQNQAGMDSSLKMNGFTFTRESNVIDDVIEDFTFTLNKASVGELINITISEDKAAAETAVRDFVDVFNAFLEAIEPAVGSMEVEDEDGDTTTEPGSLSRESTARAMVTQIRSEIVNAVPGLSSGFTTLGTIGIRTELDGTLSIDEDVFTAAFEDNFDLVQSLFASNTSSTSDKVVVNGFGDQTVPGTYSVVISQAPEKGNLVGVAAAGTLLADLVGAGATDYDFTITVDGTTSGTISLTPGTYADQDALAAHIQSRINGDSALKAVSADVDVIWNTDHFEVTSRNYGVKSTVTATTVGASAVDLGLAAGTSTAGKDVVGTVDGVAGFGVGNVLLPALKQPAEGLKLLVKEGATSGTVNFSRGFAGELSQLIDSFLDSNGTFDLKEDSLDSQLEGLDDDQDRLDRRIDAFHERLLAQFIAMERILSGLSSSGGFLDGILDRLPFTASNG